jgi:hypothetical protein
MKAFLLFFLIAVVLLGGVLALFYLPDWLVDRRRRRRDLGSVKPSWLNDHGYSREGDDRQAK